MRRLLLFLALALPAAACGSSSQTTSTENGPIAFAAPFGDPHGIYLGDLGGERRQLTNADKDFYPTWSPDGTKIAFLRGLGGEPASHIYVMDADGGGLHQVGTAVADNGGLAWSPDGEQIAFGDGRVGGISTINLDGTGLTRLTKEGGSPAWSPDGETIVFWNPPTLYAMDADGGGVRQLVEPRGSKKHVYAFAQPSWSRRGEDLVFVRTDILAVFKPNALSIMVANADASGARKVAAVSYTEAEIVRPTWSPDGESITFAGKRGERRGIWTVRASGGVPRLLFAGDRYAMPSWGPAGT